MVTFLLRYNELGLKSPSVRARFQKQLIENIEKKFIDADLECFINTDWGRIYLDTNDKNKGSALLQTVFGLVSFSPVTITSSELMDISSTTLEICQTLLHRGNSFALRTRRTGDHEYTSQGLAEFIGAEILKKYKSKKISVNLSKPDVEVFIEVRNKRAFIFSTSISGPGGLPLSTQGKVIGIFSNKLSYISCWLMMKRGCRVYPVSFKNNIENSYTIADSEYQLELLEPWAPKLKLKVFDDRSGSEKDFLNNYELIEFIQRTRAKGICLSYDLDEFTNIQYTTKLNLPIFYPLIGLNKNKIEELENIIKMV